MMFISLPESAATEGPWLARWFTRLLVAAVLLRLLVGLDLFHWARQANPR